jgi:uncharacterized protein (TIGR02466 family)
MRKDTWWGIPIWAIQINPLQIDYSNITKEIYEMKATDKGRNKSNYGGWQSNFINLQLNTETNKLLAMIEHEAQQCFEEIKVKNTYLRKISTAWANVNKHRDSNEPHNHPESILSGCIYVQTNSESGRIKFHRSPSEDYFYNTYCDGNYNDSYIYYIPINYAVLIFPSYLMHSVEPNNSNEDRISIAFNIGH